MRAVHRADESPFMHMGRFVRNAKRMQVPLSANALCPFATGTDWCLAGRAENLL